jgi:hypothetical protein
MQGDDSAQRILIDARSRAQAILEELQGQFAQLDQCPSAAALPSLEAGRAALRSAISAAGRTLLNLDAALRESTAFLQHRQSS